MNFSEKNSEIRSKSARLSSKIDIAQDRIIMYYDVRRLDPFTGSENKNKMYTSALSQGYSMRPHGHDGAAVLNLVE